jgi:Co/Zn/Cd efflux system component
MPTPERLPRAHLARYDRAWTTPNNERAGSPVRRKAVPKGRLAAAMMLATTYLVAEVIGGIWSGSLALLADAGHMLTDVAGLGLALLALRFSEKPATPKRTYGYYRAEILAALRTPWFSS